MKFTTSFPGNWLYPKLLWRVKTDEKIIYLTFDDGPHPEITMKVLDILGKYNAKATFFCVGNNVEKYPGIYHEILKSGNQTGNHTFHHLNGWKTKDEDYFNDISQCKTLVDSEFFRPPYGKIKRSQIKLLKKEFTIVMWSALTYDFSQPISPQKCLQIALKNTGKGSIVVFHDSVKAAENMLFALPLFLQYFTDKGFKFQALTT